MLQKFPMLTIKIIVKIEKNMKFSSSPKPFEKFSGMQSRKQSVI